jgi:Caspase domain/Tetratricopeptide repeat
VKKVHFLFVLLFVIIGQATAQTRKPKTYALIIGVSKYKNTDISSLNYAHIDADAFYQFCLSPLGLAIPQSQVKLLTNEDATLVNIEDELFSLKSLSKKNDIVYIYFAGHGAIESTKLKLGYLLAHDSKYMQQSIRAIPLRLVDETVEHISIENEAKVFLITDACHSGKLADPAFTNDSHLNAQLSRIQTMNEVRITSCKEFELSFEDKAWGNGRGVFSYFLLRGMAGEADGIGTPKKDGSVSIGEINNFLIKNVPTEVNSVKQSKQNPIIKGSESIVLNQFKPGAINEVVKLKTNDSIAISNNTGSRGLVVNSAVRDFAQEVIDEKFNNEKTDVRALSTKSPAAIKRFLLKEFMKINAFTKRKLSPDEGYKLIAKILYEKYLDHMDPYVCGSVEKTTNSFYSNIDTYIHELPYVLEIANKLLQNDHYLVKRFTMQKEYLSGCSVRLKIIDESQTDMIEEALTFQNKALALAPEAAYVHNELGLLHLLKGEKEKARSYFESAIEIAPLWVIPKNNLSKTE